MNDFDFLTGTWDIANRWHTDFLDPASKWEEFPGISRASRHFGGAAGLQRDNLPDQAVLRADPPPAQPGHPPVVALLGQQADRHAVPASHGTFTDGVGEFFGEDTHNDVPVLARFRWTDITVGSAR